MKIKHYNDAIDWLTRPKFNGGGSVKNKEVLPKRKPEEELKKRKKKRFEKLKEYLENPEEVEEMLELQNGGNVDLSRGTPSIVDNEKFQTKVKNLRDKKTPVKKIAEKLKVSVATIERTVKKIGEAGKAKKEVVAQTKLKEAYDKFVKDTGEIPRIQDMRNAGLSQEAIERAQREGLEFGRRGEGKGSARAKVVNDDLIAMSKSNKIKKALADEIIPNVQDVIKVTSATDEASALNRLVQLSGAITEGKKGLDLKLDNYKKGAKLILDNADVLNEQIRTVAEQSIGESVGEDTTRNPRKDISRQKLTPGYAIDEPAGVMSSYRRGSQPYGIFSQIIGSDINVGDKFSFDAYKSIKEKQIQMAKGPERIKKINEFNKGVSKYEKILNQDRKPGELKVRLFRASSKNPSQTVKRFSEFPASYQKAFTDNYNKLGYSFEVPKDVKTIFEIRDDVKKPAVAKQITERLKSGSPRLYSKIPIISTMYDVAKSIPGDVGKANYLSAGFKTLGLVVAPYVAYTTFQDVAAGKNLVEALERNLIGTDIIGGTKDILAMSPEEREARAKVKQEQIAELNIDMPTGFGFIEAPPVQTDMSLEEAKQKFEAGKQRVAKERAETEAGVAAMRKQAFDNLKDTVTGNRAMAVELAGGRLLKQAGKRSGPPPEKGPGGLASLEDYARTMME